MKICDKHVVWTRLDRLTTIRVFDLSRRVYATGIGYFILISLKYFITDWMKYFITDSNEIFVHRLDEIFGHRLLKYVLMMKIQYSQPF